MRWFLIVGWLLVCTPLSAQDSGTDAAALQVIAKDVDAVPDIDTLLAACPADIFETRVGWFQWFDSKDRSELRCADDLALCVQDCVAGDDGHSCFFLAERFQDADDDTPEQSFEMTARKFHALACAQGLPAGCTNRGGGIRNWTLDEDPFADLTAGVRDACLFNTFEQACTAGDAWGCAMAGQAHANAEGTKADPDQARARFSAACFIAKDPGFEACVFANSQSEALDEN